MKTLGDVIWKPIMMILVNEIFKNVEDFTKFMHSWELEVAAHFNSKFPDGDIKITSDDISYIHEHLADCLYKKKKINLVDLIPEPLKEGSALTVFDAEARAFENNKPDVSSVIHSITQH